MFERREEIALLKAQVLASARSPVTWSRGVNDQPAAAPERRNAPTIVAATS